ncbi:class I SAM-dependent methyltransferase [Gorillibacterium massiliense]|uniref:class I SAM-dependent methyltransferase n=1 Tax=Gorillibacterium massiliense TaxID=1280390 RepID=UPI0004B3C84D|nr:class I SAM-dependent methyltransferase [Gorillibacterium massiliense]
MNYLDMLTKLGEASAHPGGFKATAALLKKRRLPKGSHVLEVGCGAGRTACFLARQGYQVTAVDQSADMLEKAQRRAAKAGLDIRFLKADAESLPFDNESFDMVFVESVTVFTKADISLGEYWRVLKKDGRLYDREIVLFGNPGEKARRRIQRFYGIRTLLPLPEWIKLLKSNRYAGSKTVVVKRTIPFITELDQQRESDPGSILDPELLQIAVKNYRMLVRYRKHLGYAVFTGKKEDASR